VRRPSAAALVVAMAIPAFASDVGQWECGAINVRPPTPREASPIYKIMIEALWQGGDNFPFKGMKVTHIDTDGHEFVRSDQYHDIKLHETPIENEKSDISWSGVRNKNPSETMTGTLKFLPHAKIIYSENLTRNDGSVMMSMTAQCHELPLEN
jgi:hypothetical protein